MSQAPLTPPSDIAPPGGAAVMRKLSDFGMVQEPRVEGTGGKDIVNIADMGNGVVRFRLRVDKTWWDGDGAGGAKGGRADRQRAECRLLGSMPMQKPGETWEYGTTFRTSVPFASWDGGLCMIMQLLNPHDHADPSVTFLPVVTCQLLSATQGQVLSIDSKRGVKTVRSFRVTPGAWTAVRYRVTVDGARGAVLVSVNGDAFKGESDVSVARGKSTAYDAKWGFYRHFPDRKQVCDDYVEHKLCYRKKL